MRSKILAAALCALVISTACRKPSRAQQVTAASPGPEVLEEGPVGGTTQVGDKYYFRGTIAGLSIEMQLLRDGERLRGSYLYPRVGKDITLNGTVDKDNNVTLTKRTTRANRRASS